MVAHGLRAQLRTGSLLTGQLYVTLNFFPDAPKAIINWAKNSSELPTKKGDLQELQTALLSIANKLDKVPIEQIGSDLHNTLSTTNVLLTQINTDIAPELRNTVIEARKALKSADQMLAPDQALQHDARETLRELTRTANSIRTLVDYLNQHPEAILRGKPDKAKDEK
jgi:paraquat-inducible protein B